LFRYFVEILVLIAICFGTSRTFTDDSFSPIIGSVQPDIIHGDRRSMRRYDCELELRFECWDKRGTERRGHGVTSDLSRKHLRFQTEQPPNVGDRLEARVAWPFLLQNVCRLQLVLRGPAVEVGGRGTLMAIESYEFQTCGERSFANAESVACNWSIG
jgi:hypothetical protein